MSVTGSVPVLLINSWKPDQGKDYKEALLSSKMIRNANTNALQNL
ncbi:MAG: hypothetical protein ACKOX6_08495 [Bdellovibrio sp.]